ncbi:hypothetical protein FACS189464_3810 [Bacteroidia bacterium]|nr:hypothetical protein FACS189430_07380 [Bacteroidia bacterium]GHT79188.1 hypothetical protein FACS189464_3810 [Bacteroidia bacterium]
MLKKSFSFFVIALIFIVGAQAQSRIGITGGYNLSGVHSVTSPTGKPFSGGENHKWSMISGFQGGVTGEFPLNESETFFLQVAATITSHGFQDNYTQDLAGDKKASRKFNFYHIQVPVNAQYKLKVGIPSIVFQAGPYFDYGLSGRQKYMLKDNVKTLNDNQKKLKYEDTSNQKIHSRFQYGIGVGAGVQVSRFQVMLGYNYGLSDLTFIKKNNGINYDTKLKNNQFFANFTFYFGKYASIFPDIE